jgi:hypothetical protein
MRGILSSRPRGDASGGSAILRSMLDGELRAEVRDDTLYLDFAVVNLTDQAVELGGKLPRNALHSSLRDDVLVIRRPFGERPVALAPGERYQETLELPLPVPPRHPIAPQAEGPRHEVEEVSLALDHRSAGEEFIATLGPAKARVSTTIGA